MGFFKDIRNLQQQAEAMTRPEHRRITGGVRAAREGAGDADLLLGEPAAEGAQARYLMASGRRGSATITAVRDTGMTVDDDPTVELDLSVTVEGASPYAVTHTQTVSRIAVASFQPGATVPVRVDPTDPHSLMIA
jgi:hypothetical protein